MEYLEEMEFEEESDLSAEHSRRKGRRRISKARQRAHVRRLQEGLSIGGIKPSIYLKYDYEKKERTGRIHRASHSGGTKWMKRQSNRVIRKTPSGQLPRKGNGYRRRYDYWNIWI